MRSLAAACAVTLLLWGPAAAETGDGVKLEPAQCRAGLVATGDGWCIPPGAVYCGNGGYCQAGQACTSDGKCRVTGAAVAPQCTDWMRQNDGSFFRVCVDDRGQRYCLSSWGGQVSRVSCN